jgi:hypothetical protein
MSLYSWGMALLRATEPRLMYTTGVVPDKKSDRSCKYDGMAEYSIKKFYRGIQNAPLLIIKTIFTHSLHLKNKLLAKIQTISEFAFSFFASSFTCNLTSALSANVLGKLLKSSYYIHIIFNASFHRVILNNLSSTFFRLFFLQVLLLLRHRGVCSVPVEFPLVFDIADSVFNLASN